MYLFLLPVRKEDLNKFKCSKPAAKTTEYRRAKTLHKDKLYERNLNQIEFQTIDHKLQKTVLRKIWTLNRKKIGKIKQERS